MKLALITQDVSQRLANIATIIDENLKHNVSKQLTTIFIRVLCHFVYNAKAVGSLTSFPFENYPLKCVTVTLSGKSIHMDS